VARAAPAQAQFSSFLAKYEPALAAQADAALERLRAQLPGAVEMVYNNYYALVVGFGPTDRPSEAVISLAIYPRWITLCFLNGASLPDPHHILDGEGKRVRHIRLDSGTLDRPEIKRLIAMAADAAPTPFDPSRERRTIIRVASKRPRPRRP
jgi:hypothetical protein